MCINYYFESKGFYILIHLGFFVYSHGLTQLCTYILDQVFHIVQYIDQVFYMVQYKYVLTWPSVSDGPMQYLLDQVFHMVQYIDQVFHMVQFKYVFTWLSIC